MGRARYVVEVNGQPHTRLVAEGSWLNLVDATRLPFRRLAPSARPTEGFGPLDADRPAGDHEGMGIAGAVLQHEHKVVEVDQRNLVEIEPASISVFADAPFARDLIPTPRFCR